MNNYQGGNYFLIKDNVTWVVMRDLVQGEILCSRPCVVNTIRLEIDLFFNMCNLFLEFIPWNKMNTVVRSKTHDRVNKPN